MEKQIFTTLLALALILFTGQNLMAQPTVAPTVPAHDAINVISAYSDSYTTGVANFGYESWGVIPTTSAIDGNNYYAFDFTGGTQCGLSFTAMDLSSMETLSVSCWVDTDTDINFSLLTNQGSSSTPRTLGTASLKAGEWNIVTFALTDAIAGTEYTLENVKGVKCDNMTVKGPLYIDDIFFYVTPIVDNNPPTMGTATFVSATHNSATIAVTSTDTEEAECNYLVKNGDTELGTFSADENGQITVTGLSQSTTYTLDIYAKDLGLNVSSNSTPVTFTTTENTTEPAVSAANPTHDAANVISVYSDYYEIGITTSTSGYFFDPTYYTIEGNEYAKIDYSETSSTQSAFEMQKQDLTSMEYLSFDYWVAADNQDATINITMLAYAADGTTSNASSAYKLTLEAGAWNTVVIPFTYYTELKESFVLDYIWGVKFHDMSSDDIIFVDNLYFYKNGGTSTPTESVATATSTVTVYPNPATDYMIVEAESAIELVTVYSIMGQTISSTVGGAQSATISVSGLSVGNYIVRIQTADGSVSMHKLIKK